MPTFNDINLKRWNESDVWTDSLWLIASRDNTGKHSGFYHGNFVPQIPRQLMLRYTRRGDVVFDPFIGGGTTAFEAERLGRHCIGIDIQPELVKYVNSRLEPSGFTKALSGDSTCDSVYSEVGTMLHNAGRTGIQLAILHPPYHNIIRFSAEKRDLSNCGTIEVFLERFSATVNNTKTLLDSGRYLGIVIGDMYTRGSWIPLGFRCMQVALDAGLQLKSVIVKNMDGNRAKIRQEGIWRYRALASDYYIFKHEYILIFRK